MDRSRASGETVGRDMRGVSAISLRAKDLRVPFENGLWQTNYTFAPGNRVRGDGVALLHISV